MFATCHSPIWGVDDFSRCSQEIYLETALPLALTGLSLLYIIIHVGATLSTRRSSSFGKSNLLNEHRSNDTQVPYSDEPDLIDGSSGSPSSHTEQTTPSTLKAKPSINTYVQISRQSYKLAILVIETALVSILFGLHLHKFSSDEYRSPHHGSNIRSATGLLAWGYVLILNLGRLWYYNRPSRILPNLWYQTAWLYPSYWCVYALQFRSVIIHPRSKLENATMIAAFILTTVLTIIAMVARRGNKDVVLEYVDDIKPSREPLASITSDWTFSWIDSMIWQGFQNPLVMADVWNLAAKDRASVLLADYRQVKKTNALAWHLLKYFKGEILTQAAWACVSGLFTFAPTLLLKAFLEYVEHPEDTPVNAAWFYITLLGITSCIKAVTDGRALWIGRKVCIRLRAIIIGEVYAKALRRRAAAASHAILGEDKNKDSKLTQQEASDDDSDAGKDTDKDSNDAQASVGTIINLMAVDSFKVSDICAYLHFLWGTTPVQFIICILLLYRILGYSSLAGILMMILVLPLNVFIAKQFTRTQKKVMAATDIRIHTTNEVLQNIRIIKYFAWEQRFSNLVGEKRDAELKALRNKYLLWTAAAGIWFGVPILITFFSFFLYTVVEKRPLIPSVAFTALSLFGLLRYPLDQLADMVAHVQESKVSVDRVEEFLREEETAKYEQLNSNQSSSPKIGLGNATLTWGAKDNSTESQSAFRLIDLSVNFVVGELNIIAGPTGSGKTSLLMAILGEMTLLNGQVYLPYHGNREDLVPDPTSGFTDSVAYCAQQAWLINDTIKNNILFLCPWDEARYKEVLAACALVRDLEILDQADQTLVGEKGITLSGGQKQRISLARALYSNSRHLLLDDCLSAVDSHTAQHIFEFCITGPLMTGRTCILVTHNVSLCVPLASFVVAMDNGKISAQGSAEDVIASGLLGPDLLRSQPGSKGGSKVHSRTQSRTDLLASVESEATTVIQDPSDAAEAVTSTKSSKVEAKVKPLTEETSKGSVGVKVIKMYLRAMGPWYYWVFALGGFVIQQIGSVGGNVWITTWANAYVQKKESVDATAWHDSSVSRQNFTTTVISISSAAMPKSGFLWNMRIDPAGQHASTSTNDVDAWYYLRIYAALGVAFILVSCFREGLIFWGSLRASAKIHRQLFTSITRAKLQFFDTTPLGQIMNRFSKDVETMDQDVSPVAVGVLGCIFSLISIVLLICVITPGFLLAAFFIALVYFAIGAFYIRASRDLKRLESIQRSPIYQHFGETLSGMVTIRAYAEESRFTRDNELRVDTHNRPFIYLWATNRWLALRVDFTGALVAFFAGVFIILSIDTIDAGSAGLSLTYAVMFTENVLWLVRLYSANEQNMNSIERMKEFIEVEKEAPPIIDDARPPMDWPSQGVVEFSHYTTRYRPDLDPVLQDLNFTIGAGERVGIVGRTGAGKSSLTLALFRGLEAETGMIIIDDINIGRIGLQDLREAITIVPQDPTLFTGTIRSNVDPFGLFTDEEIFSVLRKVQLIDSTTSMVSTEPMPPRIIFDVEPETSEEGGKISKVLTNSRENSNVFLNLQSAIAESGSNLSQGQRQLLCLARALLKAPRVLVMDEATASIDYATDTKIQATLREVKDSTIMTIAHRLQTIIDYDKVLVLDRGRLVEYEAPWDLIEREGSVFRSMCEMSGDLETLLEEAGKAKRNKTLIDV